LISYFEFVLSSFGSFNFSFQAIDDRDSLVKDVGQKTLSFIDQNKRGMGGVQLWLMAALLQDNE
jgi:hypothetical protein